MEAEPYAIAYIAGGFALGGAVLGGVINGVVNYCLNNQRAKQEDRDRSVRLKLASIEKAFDCLSEIEKTTGEGSELISDNAIEATMNVLNYQKKQQSLIIEIAKIILLYIPEVSAQASELEESMKNSHRHLRSIGEHIDEKNKKHVRDTVVNIVTEKIEIDKEIYEQINALRRSLVKVVTDKKLI